MNRKESVVWFLVPFAVLIAYLCTGAYLRINMDDPVAAVCAVDCAFAVFCLVEYWFFVFRDADIRSDLPPKYKWRPFGLIAACMIFFVFVIVTQILGAGVVYYFPDANYDAYLETASVNTGLYIFVSVTVAPICEELLFRGLFYGMHRRLIPGIAAAVVCSFLFGIWC